MSSPVQSPIQQTFVLQKTQHMASFDAVTQSTSTLPTTSTIQRHPDQQEPTRVPNTAGDSGASCWMKSCIMGFCRVIVLIFTCGCVDINPPNKCENEPSCPPDDFQQSFTMTNQQSNPELPSEITQQLIDNNQPSTQRAITPQETHVAQQPIQVAVQQTQVTPVQTDSTQNEAPQELQLSPSPTKENVPLTDVNDIPVVTQSSPNKAQRSTPSKTKRNSNPREIDLKSKISNEKADSILSNLIATLKQRLEANSEVLKECFDETSIYDAGTNLLLRGLIGNPEFEIQGNVPSKVLFDSILHILKQRDSAICHSIHKDLSKLGEGDSYQAKLHDKISKSLNSSPKEKAIFNTLIAFLKEACNGNEADSMKVADKLAFPLTMYNHGTQQLGQLQRKHLSNIATGLSRIILINKK